MVMLKTSGSVPVDSYEKKKKQSKTTTKKKQKKISLKYVTIQVS